MRKGCSANLIATSLLCQTRFEETLQEVAENEAQAKRVRQLFLPALGRMMFNGAS